VGLFDGNETGVLQISHDRRAARRKERLVEVLHRPESRAAHNRAHDRTVWDGATASFAAIKSIYGTPEAAAKIVMPFSASAEKWYFG
jgi:hypothetical protein